MNFVGLNLTVPHKLLAVNMVDLLDESAKAWGAVNTIRFEGQDERGTWRPLREFAEAPRETRAHGFNTDADAITRALREDLGLVLSGAKILLLGAGGAGRTAALKLASEGVSSCAWSIARAAKPKPSQRKSASAPSRKGDHRLPRWTSRSAVERHFSRPEAGRSVAFGRQAVRAAAGRRGI
jgi:shikimate 5-dehydrogenase